METIEITPEYIEQVKQDWLRDPCYDLSDLADEPGFAPYIEGLKSFQERQVARWQLESLKKEESEAKALGMSLEDYKQYAKLTQLANSRKASASRLLRHYLQLAGIHFDYDMPSEVHEIANDLVEAATLSIQAQMIKDKALFVKA